MTEIHNLQLKLKNYEEKTNMMKEKEKNLKFYINQKEKEIKRLKIKMQSKYDLNQSTNKSNSYSINLNNSKTSSVRLSSSISNKEEKYTKISLIKNSFIPKEKTIIQEKLKECKKLIYQKMKDITNNKKLSKSIEYLSERNYKGNKYSFSFYNYNINKKLNELSFNSFKEEGKKKIPIKKFIFNNQIKSKNKQNENNFNNEHIIKRNNYEG